MNPDDERRAEAMAILETHGADAQDWIVGRIVALRFAGDSAGAMRLREVAARLDEITAGDPATRR